MDWATGHPTLAHFPYEAVAQSPQSLDTGNAYEESYAQSLGGNFIYVLCMFHGVKCTIRVRPMRLHKVSFTL